MPAWDCPDFLKRAQTSAELRPMTKWVAMSWGFVPSYFFWPSSFRFLNLAFT
jgi:hypothetical protein